MDYEDRPSQEINWSRVLLLVGLLLVTLGYLIDSNFLGTLGVGLLGALTVNGFMNMGNSKE